MKKRTIEGTAVSVEPQETTQMSAAPAQEPEQIAQATAPTEAAQGWWLQHQLELVITIAGIVVLVGGYLYLQYRSGLTISESAAEALADAASSVE